MSQLTLPILDNLRVASPCEANWDAMAGDDRVRHCKDCQLHVYNLSALSREEATALVEKHEGRLCVRYYQRADGTVLTRDCPRGLKAAAARMRRLTIAAAALALFLMGNVVFAIALPRKSAASFLSTGETRRVATAAWEWMFGWLYPEPPHAVTGVMVMGDVCPAPPPPTNGVSGTEETNPMP